MDYKHLERNTQLINELFVEDLQRSLAFYTALGFLVQRADDHFAVLRWEDSLLFLDQQHLENRPAHAGMNIRILVPDVDNYWDMVQAAGYPVLQAIDNRYYGLRDFTISDLDGFGVRFGTFL